VTQEDVTNVQAGHFTDAHPGCILQIDEGAIAQLVRNARQALVDAGQFGSGQDLGLAATTWGSPGGSGSFEPSFGHFHRSSIDNKIILQIPCYCLSGKGYRISYPQVVIFTSETSAIQ
jgi:hypothetical protein